MSQSSNSSTNSQTAKPIEQPEAISIQKAPTQGLPFLLPQSGLSTDPISTGIIVIVILLLIPRQVK